MTQQVINTGLVPNDGTGAPLRTAFTETNVNFDQIWTAGPVGSNVRISGNRILTINTNGNLTLAPNGTGRVVANVDVVPNLSNVRNLGSATQRWDTVYTQYLDITGELSLSSIEVDDLTVNGNLTVNGTTTTINTANLDVTDKLITIASGSPNAAVANGAGILVDGADATITYDHDTMSWVINLPLVVDGNITATTFVGDLTGTADFANTANSVTAANVSGLSEVATSGSYTDLSNTPTDVSAFDNDAGYITESAIPTQVSAFSNDAGYITSAAIPTQVSAFENDSGYITESAIPTQVSAFSNDANYITSAVANVISVNGATGVVSLEIPTATSNLSNDSGFITSAAIPTQVSAFENDANYITSAVANVISVNGATGVVSLEIPTATSDLSNDSGFITANVVGNLSATGNITGVYIKGNGSELTNLPAPAVAQDITSTGDMSIMTYDGNLKYVNNATVEPSTGSIKTAGNISATGNITGSYIFGNGSQLTGLPATYGNSNVATFLAAYGSNTISTTGNISSGNISTGVITLTNGAVIKDNDYVAVAFGLGAGTISQGISAVAVGYTAGYNNQGNSAVAIGEQAGNYNQGNSAVAIGEQAGNYNQGTYAVALGYFAGNTNQGGNSVAIGGGAGAGTQGEESVAIGAGAGSYVQGNAAVAVGTGAGAANQRINSVAIGASAGAGTQGQYAVAIGASAGTLNQGNNSIILNATGVALNQTTANTFTVAPVRNDVANTGNVMFYNAASKEITYGNTISVAGNVTAGNFVGNGAALSNVTVSVAGNIIGTQSNVTLVAGAYNWTFNNAGNLTLPGNTFAVNYANNTPVDVVTRFESSWTVPVGNSIQSFTVGLNETYYMWVDCNIPQGILTWNATATVTNNNVPVVGVQYAWVYDGGGTPIDFISIPDQFIGTANAIIRSNTSPSATTNRFDFGINNASGRSQTVRYGWIKIS